MTRTRIKFQIPKFTRKLQLEIKRRMSKVAFMLEAFVKRSIGTSTRAAGPSKPNTAPHADTGLLRRSITAITEIDGKDVIVRYGTLKGIVPYARRLELGFTGRDSRGRLYRQEPRPYLRPAYTKNKRKIKQIIRKG